MIWDVYIGSGNFFPYHGSGSRGKNKALDPRSAAVTWPNSELTKNLSIFNPKNYH